MFSVAIGINACSLFMHSHMSVMLFSSSTRPFGQDFIASGETGLFYTPFFKETQWLNVGVRNTFALRYISACSLVSHIDERSGWNFVMTLSNLINVLVVPNSPQWAYFSASYTRRKLSDHRILRERERQDMGWGLGEEDRQKERESERSRLKLWHYFYGCDWRDAQPSISLML